MTKDNKEFENPIDPDKIAVNPGLLEYASNVGSALIKPTDKGKIRGRGLAAMEKQSHRQLEQIYGQIETLAKQAQAIKERVEVSSRIYLADMSFEPLIGHTYFLYQKNEDKDVLSMIAPDEWGRTIPYASFIASVELLPDHTWEVRESNLD